MYIPLLIVCLLEFVHQHILLVYFMSEDGDCSASEIFAIFSSKWRYNCYGSACRLPPHDWFVPSPDHIKKSKKMYKKAHTLLILKLL